MSEDGQSIYPAEQVTAPDQLGNTREVRCQVCVIGTGAGGGFAARNLAQRGIDVVSLEEGLYYTGKDFAGDTPVQSFKRVYRDNGLTFAVGTPGILMPYGKCVGGTTVINSGTALRMSEETFDFWCREHGLTGLSWSELEQHFQDAEKTVGQRRIPKKLLGNNTLMIQRGTEALGYEGEVVTRNAKGCRQSGRCFLGCPSDAKQAMNVSAIPQALQAGGRLFTGCRAERILSRNGKVTGVEASVDTPGSSRRRRVTFQADVVVVAAGAVHSPVLLRKSGLGHGHRHFGKNLRMHPASRVVGLFDEEIRGQYDVPQGYHLTGFMKDRISIEGIHVPPAVMAPGLPGFGKQHLELMRRYQNIGIIGYRVIDTTRGSVGRTFGGMPLVWYDINTMDTANIVKSMSLSAEIMFAAGASKVLLPVFGREELNSIDEARALKDVSIPATDIELSAYHAHGTLRMSKDSESGLTSIDGRYHGFDNLYVADASLFPESSIVNPQMTIMALASHVASRIQV